MKKMNTILNNEEQQAEHAWLVFLYDLNLVSNLLYHFHNKKTEAIKVPVRYKQAYFDCMDYWNRWYGGKDGQA